MRVATDEESLETGVSELTAEPETLDLAPGLVTVTVLVMVQVKLTELACDWLSVAVMVTAQAHAVVGVPLITPADEMTMPTGRPVADQVKVAVVDVSVAVAVIGVMRVPDTFDLALVVGLVTATVLVMFHVNETGFE